MMCTMQHSPSRNSTEEPFWIGSVEPVELAGMFNPFFPIAFFTPSPCWLACWLLVYCCYSICVCTLARTNKRNFFLLPSPISVYSEVRTPLHGFFAQTHLLYSIYAIVTHHFSTVFSTEKIRDVFDGAYLYTYCKPPIQKGSCVTYTSCYITLRGGGGRRGGSQPASQPSIFIQLSIKLAKCMKESYLEGGEGYSPTRQTDI